MTLTLTPLDNIPLIKPGDNLIDIIWQALNQHSIQLISGDIIVIAQKIVSKAENRTINLTEISPSEKAIKISRQVEKDPRFIELVLRESREILRMRPGLIIVEHKNGFICANAGIDHSNVDTAWGNSEDWVLLLPKDADASADTIRNGLEQISKKKLGVLIIDSHGRSWRIGTVGVTIGLSGLPAIVDLRGQADIFGYRLKATIVGVADELAASASLVMGQASERIPVVHVRGFPYSLNNSSLKELIRSKKDDLFR